MKKHTIQGTVHYHNLEGGFWGITDTSGGKWLPINLPEQLKMENRKVKVKVKELDEETMIMWGTPVKVISFETITP